MRPPHGGAFPISDSGERADTAATPLVLLPGIGGPRGTFHHQVNAFTDDRRTVALNLNPARKGGVSSVDSSAHDIEFALDSLGLARVDLAAASFGTVVATTFALRHPTRVRKLVWIAPPVVRHGPWRRTFGPGWLVGGALLAYMPERGRGTVARFLARSRWYTPEPDLTSHELELLGSRATDTQVGAFLERLVDLTRWDWHELPAPFPIPLLVIQGRTEHAVTPHATLEAWRALSGRDIAVVPGHHMPYLSYPREFNAALYEFLAEPMGPAHS